MTYPHRPASQAANLRLDAPVARPWTVTPQGHPARIMQPSRRYEVLWQDHNGSLAELTKVAPAMPAFETAFTAFARGALIATPSGEVAIEDLLPGTLIQTRLGPLPVRWIGRITLPPANLKQDGGPDIFRVSADAFGPQRPAPDLVLCSGARLVHRVARLAAQRTGPDLLVPIADFADGVHVTQINPMSSVTAYHLALDSHSVIEVNRLAVETYHPGSHLPEGLTGDLLRLFLSLFPHLREPSDFGPLALPRLGLDAIDDLAATA
ncbi:Hint domain-containing protein [Frigidibacter sp. ROC022]|uniref:Hint domain-containing protein n=1 Tax=Frigidibacter sp. ROC022 TaxID=2971796 RepID=UPI00215AE376|nr:Hint domain-containing protein [Frigidibacter sp. ROC022]MCR8725855.1 Hint domain-containing protein [Frigidibacter sp. ROC022]